MTREDINELKLAICEIMEEFVTRDYARHILEHEDDGFSIMDYIAQNVIETSAWQDEGYYNYSDIKLAIGRVLMEKLDVEN